MLDLLTQYGLTREEVDPFSNDPAGLIKLRAIYEANVASMKGNSEVTEKLREAKQNLREKASSNETLVSQVKESMTEIRAVAYNCFDTDNDSLILLLDAFEEFTSILNFELKELIANTGKSSEEVTANRATLIERYEAAEKLQKMILSIFALQKGNLKLTDKTFSKDGQFPLKDSKAEGLTPDLSRLPHNPNKQRDTSKSGRPVHNKSLRFNWNGEDLPVGTMGTHVAKELVSDGKQGVRVQWKDIKQAVEKLGKNLAKDSWELTYETGTLKGWVDSNVVTSKTKK